jgi:hypothetical protein
MENMLKELIAILEKQIPFYRSMLKILQDEKKAVVGAKLPAVNSARIQKEDMLSQIMKNDAQRKNVIKRISDHMGCPPQGLTLTQLAQKVEAPFSLKLIRSSAEISLLVQKIHTENEMNRSLITHSLNLIGASIDLVARLMIPPPIYFHNGKTYTGEVCGTVLSSSV